MCGGFLWDGRNATLCKPNTFFYVNGSSTSSFGYKKNKCTCATLLDDSGGCKNFEAMTAKTVLRLSGGEQGCYDACRAQDWCTNYMPQPDDGTAGPLLCRLAGPETCQTSFTGVT